MAKALRREVEYNIVCQRTPRAGLRASKVVHFKDAHGYTRRASVALATIDAPMPVRACQAVVARLKRAGAQGAQHAFEALATQYPVQRRR
jgi:hypothetical protein